MKVFVFGSNEKGIHGAGAAKHARLVYEAKTGDGVGPTGNAYAIPTKIFPSSKKRQLLLSEIQGDVNAFLAYAREWPEKTFAVSRIGCGLAGYTNAEIAPMFAGAPDNCEFDPDWAPWGLKPWKEAP
jgi:hypothetical protein